MMIVYAPGFLVGFACPFSFELTVNKGIPYQAVQTAIADDGDYYESTEKRGMMQ